MDEKVINILINNFPWADVAIAAFLSTMIMTAIATTFYYEGSGNKRGAWFHLWEVLVCAFSTLVVTEVTDLSTFASIQNFVFNVAAIFVNSVLLYNFVGEPVIEQRVGPMVRKFAHMLLDKLAKVLGVDETTNVTMQNLKTTVMLESQKKTPGPLEDSREN